MFCNLLIIRILLLLIILVISAVLREARQGTHSLMSKLITESAIETFAIELFEKLGYQYVYAPDIAPDSVTPLPITISGEVQVEI